MSTFTPEQHFTHMAEFVRGVELSGGTTPHVSMTVEAMSRIDDPLEKLWFAGCYALTYNWPAAERLFLEVRPAEVTRPDFDMFLEDHWAGLPLRKERKAVYRHWAFAESAVAYVGLARDMVNDPPWPLSYESAFSMFNQETRFMGRYIAIRWLEVMRRAFPDQCAGWVMPSILSDGGEHPRKALSLIYPADAEMLLKGNTREHIWLADHVADRLLLDLQLEYGITTDFYELQSLLCEYKQSALGQKQYPGKSIDTEMDYLRKIRDYWCPIRGSVLTTAFTDVRAACFPEWSLGELQGWGGVRPELGAVLVKHGYTWSDAVYDYMGSLDLVHPARREDGEMRLLP